MLSVEAKACFTNWFSHSWRDAKLKRKPPESDKLH